MALYALNLFDLADNALYRQYSRRSVNAVGKHDGPHPLREDGTRNYLWWTYERLEDLRPLFGKTKSGNVGRGG